MGSRLPRLAASAGAAMRPVIAAPQQTFLPPTAAWVEILVLLVPAILLEAFWPAFPDISQFQPHPYWFPVLLLSLQYGTVSGLAAAAVAIAGTLLIGLPEADIGENYFLYLVRVWRQPVLWVMAATIIGQFRMRQITANRALTERVNEMTEQTTTLAAHANALRGRCDLLERRIVTRPASDGDRVLDRLAALAGADEIAFAAHFSAASEAAFPGGTLSLYVAGPTGLSVIASGGPRRGAVGLDQPIPLSAPIWDAHIRQGSALTILSAEQAPALDAIGVAAVPVGNRLTGAVTGMLVADMLPAPALNGQTLDRLAVLANHAGDALSVHALPVDGVAALALALAGGPASAMPISGRWQRWRHSIRSLGAVRPVDARGVRPTGKVR